MIDLNASLRGRTGYIHHRNTGKPYARSDEGGQMNVTIVELLRHRQKKGAVTDRFSLQGRQACFLLCLWP